jgi:nicotinate phosphoribosyltransferase
MHYHSQVSPLYTDLYQLTMAQAYFQNGMQNKLAGFDYFFRKVPFKGGFVVFAGLQELLHMIKDLRFMESDLDYLRESGFDTEFLQYLKDFSFKGNISSVREGDIVFPFEPVVKVEGNVIEAQLIETLLLNILNFQSLIATKAARLRYAAGPNAVLSDFGLRRAQSFGAMHASRAAIIGGFDNTSNVLAAKKYGIPHAGTMAHSFIESFGNEENAFKAYAKSFPDNSVFLVDTYNTLYSGIPNAIKVAKEMRKSGKSLKGIRLDSGDLAYLSKKAREMLDYDGFQDVRIVVSNQLDEYVIKSLREQRAPIDIYGVGTTLVTGKPDAALDGVYKLAYIETDPVLKISDNLQKTTLPGKKKVLRYFDREGLFYADAIILSDEADVGRMVDPFEKLKSLSLKDLKCEELFYSVMKNGEIVIQDSSPQEFNARLRSRLNLLPVEHQRFDFPHIYKVGISEKLMKTRDELLLRHK